jgi:tetratricopeptide (TPR) repeat protein
MTELYSVKDVARIFAEKESRLRYWMQVGVVGPTVRKGGRFYYTFHDVVAVKAAKDLLAAGLPVAAVRKNLVSLREALPGNANAAAKLRICSDGETVVAVEGDQAYEPATRQVVMAFELPVLAGRIAEVLAPDAVAVPTTHDDNAAVPRPIADDPTEANSGNAAYRCFVEACAALDRDDPSTAEHLYRQALDLEPNLASALTNLGNLLYRRGHITEARAHYERALDVEPMQPEARYNLANILEDLGEIDLAIAELRRVVATAPDFADAHYNLGLVLARVGGATQARHHLARYLELDPESEWAELARAYLSSQAGAEQD